MKNSNLLAVAAIAIFSAQISATNLISSPLISQITIEVVEGDFVEVDQTKLPEAIKNAVSKDYAGSIITKAFVNKDGIYKLVISHNEKESTVFANTAGEWVEL